MIFDRLFLKDPRWVLARLFVVYHALKLIKRFKSLKILLCFWKIPILINSNLLFSETPQIKQYCHCQSPTRCNHCCHLRYNRNWENLYNSMVFCYKIFIFFFLLIFPRFMYMIVEIFKVLQDELLQKLVLMNFLATFLLDLPYEIKYLFRKSKYSKSNSNFPCVARIIFYR